jgi:hypothetical protein
LVTTIRSGGGGGGGDDSDRFLPKWITVYESIQHLKPVNTVVFYYILNCV